MAAKRTMTLNLNSAEMEALLEIAERKELSKTAVIRQALRLYSAVDARLRGGDKLVFEGEDDKKAEVLVL